MQIRRCPMNAFCQVPLLRSTRAWCNFTCISRWSSAIDLSPKNTYPIKFPLHCKSRVLIGIQIARFYVLRLDLPHIAKCQPRIHTRGYMRFCESTVTCSGRSLNLVIVVANWLTESWVTRGLMKSADYSENVNRSKHYTGIGWYHLPLASHHLKLKVE